jgi:hypothetical protein
MVLFGLSVVASAVSLFVNVRIFASSLRKRLAPKVGSGNRIQVQVQGNGMARTKSVQDLKDELEQNKFTRWQHYCTGLLIAVEVCLDTRAA